MDRRRFLETMAAAGMGALLTALPGVASAGGSETAVPRDVARLYAARRNLRYRVDRPISRAEIVESYNNYYEFGDTKDAPAHASQKLTTRPWVLEIAGLVQKPFSIDRDDLVRRMKIEERVYRHRCVEAWSIAVPWTGFPLKALIDLARPLASAKYLRTVSFHRPSEAPEQGKPWYPFPYFEGFRMDEATHELAFVATGSYGRELPKQNGLPIAIKVPWKYGYKSPKAVVRFEFTEQEPPTFWHSLSPFEYGFLSNVQPAVPHPRWSQETEKFFGPGGIERRPTLPYNGYAEFVARLYPEEAAGVRR